MMSIGRGRGRLFTSEEVSRPGGGGDVSSSERPTPLPFALEPLFQGSVDDLTVFWALYNSLTRRPANAMQDVERVLDYIFSEVVGDPSNSEHIAKYIYLLSKHPSLSEQLLRTFFNHMESMFNDRDNIRISHGTQGLRNLVTFFCDVTHFTRNQMYAPFPELISALRTLFEPFLLSCQDEDLKLFAICMVRYSKYLKMVSVKGVPVSQFASQDYLDLTIRLRKRLARGDPAPSEIGTAWLLLCFESMASGFDGIPEPIRHYYTTVLGHQINILSTKNDILRVPKSEAHNFMLNEITNFVTLV